MKLDKSRLFQLTIIILIILPYLGLIFTFYLYDHKVKKIQNATFILVSKEEMKLSLYNYKGNMLYNFPIACGLNFGDKTTQGDMKTPEGVFHVTEILKSQDWSHDFNDGNGEVEGAYGPYFIRLDVPGFSGIGIHGTHNPTSIEKRVTEGCIRMKNQDLLQIVPLINPGTVVIITTSAADIIKYEPPAKKETPKPITGEKPKINSEKKVDKKKKT